MKKPIWFVMVAMLVLIPLLAACGGGAPAPAPSPTPAPTPAPAPGPAPAPTAGPPAIPHTLEGRDDCLMCHGESGIKPFPADHAGRTSDICTSCHEPGA